MPTDHPSDHLPSDPDEHEPPAAQVSSDDLEAPGDLYDRDVQRAYAVAWAILGTKTGADDAVTDGILDVARRCITIRPASVSAAWWLCRVSEHAMDDRRRGHGAPGRLSGLTETQGQVLALACAGCLSRSEIATELRLSTRAVAQTMNLALIALRSSPAVGPTGCHRSIRAATDPPLPRRPVTHLRIERTPAHDIEDPHATGPDPRRSSRDRGRDA